MQLTPAQQLNAMLYAPPIAFMQYWNHQQAAARVLTRSYVDLNSWRSTVALNYVSMQKHWKLTLGISIVSCSFLISNRHVRTIFFSSTNWRWYFSNLRRVIKLLGWP
jgi:hypothetical protein